MASLENVVDGFLKRHQSKQVVAPNVQVP